MIDLPSGVGDPISDVSDPLAHRIRSGGVRFSDCWASASLPDMGTPWSGPMRLLIGYVVLAGCSCSSGRIRQPVAGDDMPAAPQPPVATPVGGQPAGNGPPPPLDDPAVTPPADPGINESPPEADGDQAPAAGSIRPLRLGTRWQWQLTGRIEDALDVEAFDIDLFDAPQANIDDLRSQGKAVICYFSAGSREDWRQDARRFLRGDYGKSLDGWSGESWLDVRSDNVRSIMSTRLDLAVERGCDAVEPDNVDGFSNDTGFGFSRRDQIEYNTFLSHEAHRRGLGVGLKNAGELVRDLEPLFDWVLTEECLENRECALFRPFLETGKAVLHTEYVGRESEAPAKLRSVCAEPARRGFSTLVKTWDLGDEFYSCDP